MHYNKYQTRSNLLSLLFNKNESTAIIFPSLKHFISQFLSTVGKFHFRAALYLTPKGEAHIKCVVRATLLWGLFFFDKTSWHLRNKDLNVLKRRVKFKSEFNYITRLRTLLPEKMPLFPNIASPICCTNWM